jgi:cytokinesis protein
MVSLAFILVVLKDVMEEYKALEHGLNRLEVELEAQRKVKEGASTDKNDQDLFLKTMNEFYDDATDHFSKVQVICQEMCEAYDTVVKYFGEDPEKMLPDEFFGILFRFRASWKVMISDVE